MKGFLAEFKAFAMKGNVVDLAVAVVIGGAFGQIVTSLVNNIVMPALGIIIGGIDFTHLIYTVGDAKIAYGLFLQAVVNFVIIAFVIFMALKLIDKAQKLGKKEAGATPDAPKEPAEDIQLLREIRDSLRQRSHG